MFKLIVAMLAVLLSFTVLVAVQTRKSIQQISSEKQTEKISLSDEQEPADNNNDAKSSEKIIPTVKVIPTAFPTTQVFVKGTSNTKYIYPGSNVVSESDSSMQMTSNDSPKAITDWYKTLINESGMNVTSFVTTNTNGNVLNKLGGSNGVENISISISRSAGDPTTRIEASLDS